MGVRRAETELPSHLGRLVKLEVQTNPKKLWAIGLAFIAGSLLFCFFGVVVMDDDPRGFIVAIASLLLFPVGIFGVYSSIQLTKMPTAYVKLGLKTLRFPRGKLLWRAHEEEVKLLQIPHVALMTQNGQMFIQFSLTDGTKHSIQAAWLPADWSLMDLYILLQLRIRGARQQLDRTQQLGAEALAFGAADVLGVVVSTGGKRPKAIAYVYDLDDYGELMDREDFPHVDHRLIVASDQLAEVRGAVEESVLSSVDVGSSTPNAS